MPTLRNLHEPAAAGAMVGIIDLLGQCKLLGAEERDPQQWYKCTSARLRDASTSIKALLASPYFEYTNNPRKTELGIGQPPGQSSRCFHLRQTNTGRADFKLLSFLSVGTKQQSRLLIKVLSKSDVDSVSPPELAQLMATRSSTHKE